LTTSTLLLRAATRAQRDMRSAKERGIALRVRQRITALAARTSRHAVLSGERKEGRRHRKTMSV